MPSLVLLPYLPKSGIHLPSIFTQTLFNQKLWVPSVIASFSYPQHVHIFHQLWRTAVPAIDCLQTIYSILQHGFICTNSQFVFIDPIIIIRLFHDFNQGNRPKWLISLCTGNVQKKNLKGPWLFFFWNSVENYNGWNHCSMVNSPKDLYSCSTSRRVERLS